ncbi:MAG: SCO family protein [Microthrixaceae bacterium]
MRPANVRILAVALVAVAATAVGATACGGADDAAAPSTTAKEFSGYTRTPAPSVAAVRLPGSDGSEVGFAAAPGGLRLVYFGYTSCPDVCPTTLSDVKRAIAALPEADRSKVAVDMVTIDPARDTAEKLSRYVTTFVPSGVAVRTDDDARLRTAARAFGADYKVTPGANGTPEVAHTAELYGVDDQGLVVLIWPFGTSREDLARDIRRLLAGERPPGDPAATSSTGTPSTAPAS